MMSEENISAVKNNGGCGSRLTRAAAWAFAIIFVVSFPLTLLAFDTAQVLFSPDEVAAAFSEELVASGILEEAMVGLLLGGEFSDSGEVEAQVLEGALEFMSEGELREISAALLPAGWTTAQVSAIVRDLYEWIDTDEVTPGLVLNLRPLKEHLFQGGIGQMVEVVVDSWPSCSMQEIELLRQVQFRLGQLPDFVCEPPEPMRSELVVTATDYLQGQFREMPPVLSLAETVSDIDPSGEAGQLKSILRLTRAIAEAAWLLPFSLLGLIMALVIRSFPELTRWCAESFFTIPNRLSEAISGLLFVHAVVLFVIGGGLLLLGRYLRGRAT
jgi:hypothetical protein